MTALTENVVFMKGKHCLKDFFDKYSEIGNVVRSFGSISFLTGNFDTNTTIISSGRSTECPKKWLARVNLS